MFLTLEALGFPRKTGNAKQRMWLALNQYRQACSEETSSH